ncbi:MAG: hypothetical protein COT74_05190 [Bdellovibrionales bacterium CG10_big_fil_rev_8_21_14_0_10_45_34]|nr:MAG: hypothetical protein COT74_05190 [Bdellovibrionales bacterium CG10_big_fil_rev_8_21_14_0_10_45_34]
MHISLGNRTNLTRGLLLGIIFQATILNFQQAAATSDCVFGWYWLNNQAAWCSCSTDYTGTTVLDCGGSTSGGGGGATGTPNNPLPGQVWNPIGGAQYPMSNNPDNSGSGGSTTYPQPGTPTLDPEKTKQCTLEAWEIFKQETAGIIENPEEWCPTLRQMVIKAFQDYYDNSSLLCSYVTTQEFRSAINGYIQERYNYWNTILSPVPNLPGFAVPVAMFAEQCYVAATTAVERGLVAIEEARYASTYLNDNTKKEKLISKIKCEALAMAATAAISAALAYLTGGVSLETQVAAYGSGLVSNGLTKNTDKFVQWAANARKNFRQGGVRLTLTGMIVNTKATVKLKPSGYRPITERRLPFTKGTGAAGIELRISQSDPLLVQMADDVGARLRNVYGNELQSGTDTHQFLRRLMNEVNETIDGYQQSNQILTDQQRTSFLHNLYASKNINSQGQVISFTECAKLGFGICSDRDALLSATLERLGIENTDSLRATFSNGAEHTIVQAGFEDGFYLFDAKLNRVFSYDGSDDELQGIKDLMCGAMKASEVTIDFDGQ